MEINKILNELSSEVFMDYNITIETEFKKLEIWDSMTQIILVDYLYNIYKIQLDTKSIKEISTIKELINLIKR